MKKKAVIAIIIFAIIAIVVVNIVTTGGKSFSVSVEKVVKRDLVEKVSATGEIRPKKNINISTDVAGKILKILFREGDLVKKGELLLKIDSAIYEANADRDKGIIASSEADLISQEANEKRAKQYFERRKQLFDEGMISRELFEEAKIQLEIAQANRQATRHRIDQARASLKSTNDSISKTSIVSPIDGIVTSLKVEEGEIAIIGTMNNPGTVLMTIADLSIMEAEVIVDETDIVRVKVGEKAEVRVDALPDVTIPGQVTEVGNSAIVTTTSVTSAVSGESKDFKTVITLKNPPQSLKPGFSATADIIIDAKKSVLTIPIAAVVLQEKKDKGTEQTAEREGVFIMQNGKAVFKEIAKGISGDMYFEVTAGLAENDKIISGPFAILKKLKDGDLVKITGEVR